MRALISGGAGYLVAVIACIAAWLPMRFMPNFGPRVLSTSHALGAIEQKIREYQWDANSLPKSLAELRPLYRGDYEWGWDENSNPLDAWGRPLGYSVDGNDFILSSFGRDGKPDGVGLDADLLLGRAEPKEFMIPLRQFIFHEPARGVVLTCLACGVVAFFAGMVVITPSELEGKGLVGLLVKLAVTTGGTVMVSLIITALHIPNHH